MHFKKLAEENYDRVYISGMTEAEARLLLEITEKYDVDVSKIECSSTNGNFFWDGYFNTHTPWFFCQEFAVEFTGWHWLALEDLTTAFRAGGKINPDDLPIFDIGLESSRGRNEFAEEMRAAVQRRRAEPDFEQRPLGVPPKWNVIEVD